MTACKRSLFKACFLGIFLGLLPLRLAQAQTAIEKLLGTIHLVGGEAQ